MLAGFDGIHSFTVSSTTGAFLPSVTLTLDDGTTVQIEERTRLLRLPAGT